MIETRQPPSLYPNVVTMSSHPRRIGPCIGTATRRPPLKREGGRRIAAAPSHGPRTSSQGRSRKGSRIRRRSSPGGAEVSASTMELAAVKSPQNAGLFRWLTLKRRLASRISKSAAGARSLADRPRYGDRMDEFLPSSEEHQHQQHRHRPHGEAYDDEPRVGCFAATHWSFPSAPLPSSLLRRSDAGPIGSLTFAILPRAIHVSYPVAAHTLSPVSGPSATSSGPSAGPGSRTCAPSWGPRDSFSFWPAAFRWFLASSVRSTRCTACTCHLLTSQQAPMIAWQHDSQALRAIRSPASGCRASPPDTARPPCRAGRGTRARFAGPRQSFAHALALGPRLRLLELWPTPFLFREVQPSRCRINGISQAAAPGMCDQF
jgi:hypothetical protein